MAIDDETRARAKEAVRRRMAGEASDEDMESALAGMKAPTVRRAVDKPTDTGDETARLTKKYGNADEMAANIKRLKAYDKPLERVAPEEYLLPPLRGLRAASAAKAAASAPRTASIMDSPVAARLAAARAEKQKSGLARAQERSTPKKSEISTMEGEGGRSFNPKMPYRAKKESARDMDESRFADEGNPNFRKGGKVSSASSRGDGIATKGKTRGRMC